MLLAWTLQTGAAARDQGTSSGLFSADSATQCRLKPCSSTKGSVLCPQHLTQEPEGSR